VPLDFNEIRQLLVTIAQSNIAELTLKTNDFELIVRKTVSVSEIPISTNHHLAHQSSVVSESFSASGAITSTISQSNEVFNQSDVTGTSTQKELSIAASLPREPKLVEMLSPMVGTFYRAPAPNEPPFVEVGNHVRVGQPICIIEAMKLMNEIEAEASGQIVEILVENGQLVEFGQRLMRIKPE
jgi:acetyl-CoA carboxylase biotin carboxyl carrier protein